MAPRPPTADLVHVKSTPFSAFASTAVTVTKQPTTIVPKMLAKFLEREIDEGADALALIRIEILRKTNLQPENEEIKVKTSISVVIKSTTKDSAEIPSFALRSIHLI